MKKVISWVLGIVEAIIIVYVIFLTSCLLFVNDFGNTQFGKYTLIEVNKGQASLLEGVEEGDLLVIKDGNDIVKGNVIYYYSVINEQYFVKKAMVTDIKEDNFDSIYTVDVANKGETNAIQGKKVIGNYISIHRKLGKVLTALESKVGFLFLVLLPMLCIFIYHVYSFIIILKFEKVDPEEEDIEILEETKPKKKRKKKK
ncbi:MAG: hypothetical protein IJI58_00500 [Bacilli bacterium]|nr:hypothetical protein [Bacilli bacterium]